MNIKKLTALSFFIASLLCSCESTRYIKPEVHIQHSSPDVISLYNVERKSKKPNALDRISSNLISGLFASSPDDDDHFGRDRYSSRKEKQEFINKNRDSIQSSLRKKR